MQAKSVITFGALAIIAAQMRSEDLRTQIVGAACVLAAPHATALQQRLART